MRRDFPASMPVPEQLQQIAALKTPGRKHQKRAGVKKKQRTANKSKTAAADRQRKSKNHFAEVRKYWTGKVDEHP